MRFLGIVEGKGLYAEWNKEYEQIRYILDEEEVAVFSTKSMRHGDPVLFKSDTIENELSAEAKDTIKELAGKIDANELKEDEERYGKKGRERISKAIGQDKDKISSVTEIDLDEEVEEENEIKEQLPNKEKEKLATTKDINVKQELKMNSMATSTKTIGKILQDAGKIPNLPDKKFTKIGVVESNSVKDIDKNANKNTTRFSFVAIANDGTVVPINLEQDHQEGNNPREIDYRTNADGSVEQDDVNSRYKIGNNGETISIKTSNGPGDLEVGYSAHKTLGGERIEGNESVDHQLETNSVYWRPRKDGRDQEYADGVRGTEEKVREAHLESKYQDNLKEDKKGKAGDSDIYKDIDGKDDTKESNHEFSLIERARKLISEYEEVADSFTEEEVVKMLEKAHDDGKEIDKAEEDIKEDAKMLKTHNR